MVRDPAGGRVDQGARPGASTIARQLQEDSFTPAATGPQQGQRRWFDQSDRFEPRGPVRDNIPTLTGREQTAAAREAQLLAEREAGTDGRYVGPNGISQSREAAGAFRPANGRIVNNQPIFYTNGINTTAAEQARQAQEIANRTGRPVYAIHNATHGPVSDVMESTRQKLLGSNTPATRTLTNEINSALARGERIEVWGHSQGAIDVSNSINAASANLFRQGLTRDQVQQRLGNISAQTFGGASLRYADGPQYRHNINERDLVASTFGLGGPSSSMQHPGRGAVINRRSVPGDSHAFMGYLGWAVPQAQAN